MKKWLKILISALVFVGFLIATYLPLKLTGLLDMSPDELRQIIQSTAYAYVIFIGVQIIQSICIPLPAAVLTLAGVLLFGTWRTIIMCTIGQTIGNCVSYLIGKKWGKKWVVWVEGEENTKKWEEKLNKNKWILPLAIMFPIIPDETLSILAGSLNIPFGFFLLSNVFVRPIGTAFTCLLGELGILTLT